MITLLLGLGKPDIFKKKNGQIATWKEIASVCGVFLVIFFILAVSTSKSGNQNNDNQNNYSQSTQPTGEAVTPPSTDPCRDYMGTDKYGFCMDMQEAAKKAEALNHPLNAIVTHNDYAVYVTNNETTEWDQCILTVNEADTSASGDNFESDGFVVKVGQIATIRWANFTNAESQRFDYAHIKPYSLDLDCVVGGHTDKTGAFSEGQHHRSMFNL